MLKTGFLLPVAMVEALDCLANITESSVVDKCYVMNVKCDYKGVPQIPTVITRVSDL